MPWNRDAAGNPTTFTKADGTVLTKEQYGQALMNGDPELQGRSFGNQVVAPITNALGITHEQVAPGAPGSSLDTSNADEDRARLGTLVQQLQQQATTGGGAWEQQLKESTGQANASVMALGQSMPGQDYGSQLQNIGNAQAGVQQRAVGQGNVLRAQSQQAGQDQLSQLLGSMGGQDASQAADSASAAQGVRQANDEASAVGSQNLGNTAKGGAQAAAALLSEGGKVPGEPKVFGDSSVNDTVKAKLSPGELVVPISHAQTPEDAQAFIRALFASRGVQHLDSGGTAGDPNGTETVGSNVIGKSGEAPSRENGGLLDTTAYDENRAATLSNANLLAGRAQGVGPSVAPQQMQNSTDSHIAAVLQALAAHHGPAAGSMLQAAGAAGEGAAGSTAAQVAAEQQSGQNAMAQTLLAQRARDHALAVAQQQAGFKNTEMNLGLDAARMSAIRGVASGAGQGLAAYSAAAGAKPEALPTNTPSFDQGFGTGGSSTGSDPSEWNNPYAEGGTVRALMPTITSRVPQDSVDVQALEPTNIKRTPHPDPEVGKSHKQQKWEEDTSGNEYSVQMAHGGAVDADELGRLSEFLTALKRRRAA